MSAPKVGKKVRGSTTGRPIMVVLDMLGRRGTLRIFWELRDVGWIEHEAGGYRLTQVGVELADAMTPLYTWAKQWGKGKLKGTPSME